MSKIKLFSAVQISRSIANKANLEARYYEYLKKAELQASKPNNALVSIVNALNRLIKSAERFGKTPQQAFAEGYFDATLDEYKRHTKSNSFELAIEKFNKERESVISSLALLGKPMDRIEAYFDNRLKHDILPMQAFELAASKAGLIEGIVYGDEYHSIAIREYTLSVARKEIASAVKVVLDPTKTRKQIEVAEKRIDKQKVILRDYGLKFKAFHDRIELLSLEAPSEPTVKNAKPRKPRAKKVKAAVETEVVL